MDKKTVRGANGYPNAATVKGEFKLPEPSIDHLKKTVSGERNIQPLTLDFSEFDEPDTKKMNYIENLDQLKKMIKASECIGRDQSFDKNAFADKLTTMGMFTSGINGKNPYYFVKDELDNQYRLYIDPTEPINDIGLDNTKRVTFDFGDRIGYLIPSYFPNDSRVEK